jgi:hypothetical protein
MTSPLSAASHREATPSHHVSSTALLLFAQSQLLSSGMLSVSKKDHHIMKGSSIRGGVSGSVQGSRGEALA